jgi:hypothetical protein
VAAWNPTIKPRIGQPEQTFVCSRQTERYDQMSDYQHSPSSPLSALQVFALRIETENPHLKVLEIHEFPKPFIRVRDTLNGIVVGFSSEADYVTYCQIISRTGGSRHA